MPIQVLSQQLANQIAAGEVIEGPVSVVKECVENAIDADASHIDIYLEKGGHAAIRIVDNGKGMDKADLERCVLAHATSKISSFDDLQAIATLGFRGEALASIASVAQLSITSHHQSEEHAWVGTASPKASGQAIDWAMTPASHPIGTTVSVRELFYLTPARKKFMRSERSDLKTISQWVERLALAQFDVGFTLYNDGKKRLELPVADQWQAVEKRVAILFGATFLKHSVYIDHEAAGMRLHGWVSLPQYDRSQADQQVSYINHRYIRDKVIMGAVKQAYRKLLFHGRHPAYVLYLDCDPKTVDVNVHPSKAEVRFADSRSVFQLIQSALTKALNDVPVYVTERDVVEAEVSVQTEQPVIQQTMPLQQVTDVIVTPHIATQTMIPTSADESVMVAERPAIDPYQPRATTTTPVTMHQEVKQVVMPWSAPEQKVVVPKHSLGEAIAQCHGRYILAQNAEGMIVVDQHAAHERILFESLKTNTLESMATQKLLVPEEVPLDGFDNAIASEFIDLLKPLGYDIALTSKGINLKAIPSILKDAKHHMLITSAWGQFLEHQDHAMDYVIDRILANMACKAAIKVNHPLTIVQMNAILRQMEQVPYGGLCNHGRPAVRFFTLAEMDGWFLRGQ
jgi:DNA mismatch repair protein MutL